MRLPNVACPPFDVTVFRRQMAIDACFRWGLFALFILAVMFLSPGAAEEATGSGSPAFIAAIGISLLWIAMTSINSGVARNLPLVSHWIETAPAQAESLLATSLQRKPLQRVIRVMLYQRLAQLRFRQGDFAQVAAICEELLRQPVASPSGRVLGIFPRIAPRAATLLRPALLLMLAEAHLHRRDLHATHACLLELHRTPLDLAEQLHRNALQTKYEVAAGLYQAAIVNLPQKIQMAELMPAPQSGAMHAMLGLAAHRAGYHEAAQFLAARAQILCDPAALVALRAQGLA